VGCVQSLSFSEGLQIEGLQGGYKEVAGGLGWIGLRIPTPWEGSSDATNSTSNSTAVVRRRRMLQERELEWSAAAFRDGRPPRHQVSPPALKMTYMTPEMLFHSSHSYLPLVDT
jgi:hypothetical protein